MRTQGLRYHRRIVRIFPILLRILLTLALVANSVGSVFAATRMQVDSFGAHAARINEVKPDAQAAAEACDEHAGMDAMAMEANGMPSHMGGDALGSSSGSASSGSADCCKAGQCVCACVLQAVGGMANMQVMEALIDRDTTTRVLVTGHAAPALPHLIRPPIG